MEILYCGRCGHECDVEVDISEPESVLSEFWGLVTFAKLDKTIEVKSRCCRDDVFKDKNCFEQIDDRDYEDYL